MLNIAYMLKRVLEKRKKCSWVCSKLDRNVTSIKKFQKKHKSEKNVRPWQRRIKTKVIIDRTDPSPTHIDS